MWLELDFRSHVPIYLQIIDRIEDQVSSGELKPGDQLPTVRQLAADLRVNFNTVARAYRMLDEAGLISTQQGRGTYVLGKVQAERVEGLHHAAVEALVRSFLADAARQGFGPDDVEEISRRMIKRWRAEGVPPQDQEDAAVEPLQQEEE